MAASGRPFLQVEAQKLQQAHYLISIRSAYRVISDSLAAPGFAYLKTRITCVKRDASDEIETQRIRAAVSEPCDSASLERPVRQLLADKISGNQAESALGAGSSCGAQSGGKLSSAMALHLVHQAAFCVNGLRNQRSLTQKGFELSSEQLACSKGLYSMPI